MTLTDLTEIVGMLAIVVGLGLWLGWPAALIALGVLLIAWSIARALAGRDRPLIGVKR
ncbi:hypothetical protein [Microbacterium sp. SL75]|uniref:hypothetical protein n=1 Tax=Microbacterium sp. SL75 TaxID=2995140 RepID=UPI00226D5013|nr:hypothetical protein [Microbacterium sp. SL75]WAC68899.1 hypothetical protein OVA17_15125 [Microbacterium sp. SL75]